MADLTGALHSFGFEDAQRGGGGGGGGDSGGDGGGGGGGGGEDITGGGGEGDGGGGGGETEMPQTSSAADEKLTLLPEAPLATVYVSSVQPGADHSAPFQPSFHESLMVREQVVSGGTTCAA